jgi:hypothetical protein
MLAIMHGRADCTSGGFRHNASKARSGEPTKRHPPYPESYQGEGASRGGRTQRRPAGRLPNPELKTHSTFSRNREKYILKTQEQCCSSSSINETHRATTLQERRGPDWLGFPVDRRLFAGSLGARSPSRRLPCRRWLRETGTAPRWQTWHHQSSEMRPMHGISIRKEKEIIG